ncbi:hypothetical protein [Halorussus pelagicus]|uniref:hypothetical protein n=1 Tax=Halorussus pelagicus TaxID=2505977 RepID=UPI000FFBF295|nr:hypothetical protein [Halorussus pelagicus]
MTDDDPFADLSQTLEDDSDEQNDTEPSPHSQTSTDESSAKESLEEHDPMKESAFMYEEAQQRPFYARQDSIEDFDSWLNYELERELSERGYQNIVVREMTDALLRTVVEEDLVNEVAERFEEAREQISSQSDK